ncbi:MAG: lysophospholipid acyltransferase family protein [Bdellovibrionales bacterium]|nr:lysophospholipid acyltransferase family protein [Bdellovibrionales bacterium]
MQPESLKFKMHRGISVVSIRTKNEDIFRKSLESLQIKATAFILFVIMRIMAVTYRWDTEGLYKNGEHWADGKPVILVFWHGQQIFITCAYIRFYLRKRKRPIHILISQHHDGRVAAATLSFFGVKSIAGSSSKGGSRALIELKRALAKDAHVGITPDGPKGPVFEVKLGPIKLSQISGRPILPLALGAERYWQLRSWDKMIIPKPFSKVRVMVGDLIQVAADASEAELASSRINLEGRLMDLSSHVSYATTNPRGEVSPSSATA